MLSFMYLFLEQWPHYFRDKISPLGSCILGDLFMNQSKKISALFLYLIFDILMCGIFELHFMCKHMGESQEHTVRWL